MLASGATVLATSCCSRESRPSARRVRGSAPRPDQSAGEAERVRGYDYASDHPQARGTASASPGAMSRAIAQAAGSRPHASQGFHRGGARAPPRRTPLVGKQVPVSRPRSRGRSCGWFGAADGGENATGRGCAFRLLLACPVRGRVTGSGWAAVPLERDSRSRSAAATRASAAGTSSSRRAAASRAGSRTERMIVASISSATATPKPICWNMTRSPMAKPTKTATMISAAPVMIRAVEPTPCATASVVSSPSRRSARGSGSAGRPGSPSRARRAPRRGRAAPTPRSSSTCWKPRRLVRRRRAGRRAPAARRRRRPRAGSARSPFAAITIERKTTVSRRKLSPSTNANTSGSRRRIDVEDSRCSRRCRRRRAPVASRSANAAGYRRAQVPDGGRSRGLRISSPPTGIATAASSPLGRDAHVAAAPNARVRGRAATAAARRRAHLRTDARPRRRSAPGSSSRAGSPAARATKPCFDCEPIGQRADAARADLQPEQRHRGARAAGPTRRPPGSRPDGASRADDRAPEAPLALRRSSRRAPEPGHAQSVRPGPREGRAARAAASARRRTETIPTRIAPTARLRMTFVRDEQHPEHRDDERRPAEEHGAARGRAGSRDRVELPRPARRAPRGNGRRRRASSRSRAPGPCP